MQQIEKHLREVTNVQRLFTGLFIVYYLFRHEPYTWHYAEELLIWPPSSKLSLDITLINRFFPLILFSWLFSGLWYFIRPKIQAGVLFFILSYLVVGRLNSYVFILRYEFSPMTYLLLMILLPDRDDLPSRKLTDAIVLLGKLVWISLFVTAGISKLEGASFNWLRPEVIRDFVYYENYLQGPKICENVTRIGIINSLMQNQVLLSIISIFTIIFELSYPLSLLSRRFMFGYLLTTIAFQWIINDLLFIQFWNYWLGIFFWFMPRANPLRP